MSNSVSKAFLNKLPEPIYYPKVGDFYQVNKLRIHVSNAVAGMLDFGQQSFNIISVREGSAEIEVRKEGSYTPPFLKTVAKICLLPVSLLIYFVVEHCFETCSGLLKGKNLKKVASPENVKEPLETAVLTRAHTDSPGEDGYTPLMKAAAFESIENVRALIEAGASVDQVDADGCTALMHAVMENREDVVELLIESGANISKEDRNKQFPLFMAAAYGYEGMTRKLLECGAEVGQQETWKGRSALHIAAISGHADVVKVLIHGLKAKGLDVNQRTNEGESPIYYAALSGRSVEVVRLLAEAGADVNAVSPNQYSNKSTPLMRAVLANENSVEVVEVLLEFGADLYAKDTYSETAYIKAEKSNNRAVMQVLEREAKKRYKEKLGSH